MRLKGSLWATRRSAPKVESLQVVTSSRDHQKAAASVQLNSKTLVQSTDRDNVSSSGDNSRASEDLSSLYIPATFDLAFYGDDDNSYLEGSRNHVRFRPTISSADAS